MGFFANLFFFFFFFAASVFPSVTHYISEAYDEWDAVQLKNHTSQMAHLALPY